MGFKITDYPAKTTFDNGDLYDVSSYDGVSAYTSEKMTFTQLKTELNSSLTIDNIGNSDLTLTGNRILDCDSYDLTFDNIANYSVNSTGVFDFDASTNIAFSVKRQSTTLYKLTASSNFNASIVLNGSTANAVGQIDMQGEKGGLILARLSALNQGLLGTPVNGLMLYATAVDATFTSKGFWMYEEGAWVKM